MKTFIKIHKEKFLVFGSIFILVTLFISLYPSMYTMQDEADYFDFTYKIKQAGIYFNPLYSHKVIFNGNGYVSMYPPGMALLLLGFSFIHYKALFLLNLLLHIGAFIAFRRILKLLKIEKTLSLLYLFFPAFILYSRTLTADMASASIFTIALLFYFNRSRRNLFYSGLLLGIICIIKYTNLIIALGLILALLLKERKKVLYIVLGFLPFAFFILLYNHFMYGGLFKTGYTYIADGTAFSVKYFLSNFPFYVSSLMLVYPLMFLSIFLYKKLQKAAVVIISLGVVMFFSSWHYVQVHAGSNPMAAFIVGMRLLLPIVPLFLLSYVDSIDRIFRKIKNYYPAINILVIGLIIVSVFISFKHQEYLDKLNLYRQHIYDYIPEEALIICDGEIPKFLQESWGKRKHINLTSSNMKALIKQHEDVYVAALIRFDKKQDTQNTKNAIAAINKKYKLKLLHDERGYFNLKVYKLK